MNIATNIDALTVAFQASGDVKPGSPSWYSKAIERLEIRMVAAMKDELKRQRPSYTGDNPNATEEGRREIDAAVIDAIETAEVFREICAEVPKYSQGAVSVSIKRLVNGWQVIRRFNAALKFNTYALAENPPPYDPNVASQDVDHIAAARKAWTITALRTREAIMRLHAEGLSPEVIALRTYRSINLVKKTIRDNGKGLGR